MSAPHEDPDEIHDHDRGLSRDLPKVLGQRRLLAAFGGVGAAAAVAGCGSSTASTSVASNASVSEGYVASLNVPVCPVPR